MVYWPAEVSPFGKPVISFDKRLLPAFAALILSACGGGSTTLNCGYGHGYSVREVLQMVERVNGKPLEVIESPRRAGDPPSLVAHASRIREVLGWAPRLDDLETIVRSQLEWEFRLLREPGLQKN